MKKAICILLSLMFFICAFPIPVSANNFEIDIGLDNGVSNALIQREVSPGDSFTESITASNSLFWAETISVEVYGFGQGLSGVYVPLTADQDISVFSARTFVLPNITSFTMNPGESQEIILHFSIPTNLQDGTYYALVGLMGQEPGPTGILINILVPVVLTKSGSVLVKTGIVEGVTATLINGKTNTLTTVFRNSGNVHYKAKVAAQILDSQNCVKVSATSPLTQASIIPGYAYSFSNAISLALPFGPYRLEEKVLDQSGTVITVRTTTFSVVPGPEPPTWDLTNDGICNIGDVTRLGLKWGQAGVPGWISEDLNNDGVIHIGDVTVLGLHWGEVWGEIR